MMIKLTAEQIVIYWDALQYAWLQTNPPPKGVDQTSYLNIFLENLLSDTSQAWVSYKEGEGEEKILNALAVTMILRDPYTGILSVSIRCLYGFRKLDKNTVMLGWSEFVAYAKNVGAQQIKLQTKVPRIGEIATLCGCVKVHETYTLDLRG